jgi:hypothetical protein
MVNTIAIARDCRDVRERSGTSDMVSPSSQLVLSTPRLKRLGRRAGRWPGMNASQPFGRFEGSLQLR